MQDNLKIRQDNTTQHTTQPHFSDSDRDSDSDNDNDNNNDNDNDKGKIRQPQGKTRELLDKAAARQDKTRKDEARQIRR